MKKIRFLVLAVAGVVYLQLPVIQSAEYEGCILCSDIGMEELYLEYSFSDVLNIYPNPAKTSCLLSINLNRDVKNAYLQIYNLIGQKVFEKNFGNLGSGIYKEKISVESMKPGIYFVKLKIDKSEIIRRLRVEE